MSKQKLRARNSRLWLSMRSRRLILAIGLTLSLLGAAMAVAQRGAIFGAGKMIRAHGAAATTTPSPVSPQAPQVSLSKEYIYGGRLIATEEPDPCAQDTQPPTITCPNNVTRSTDPGLCSAVVTYATPSVSDNCPGVGPPTCNPQSGSTFLKGTTTVNCTVADARGNQASCSFTATVNDTQAPTITCPNNVTKSTDPGLCSAVVTYATPSVSDNCPGVGPPTCNPSSGSTFLKGTTTVNCTVADASNNQASCSFTATVNDTQAPTISCPANVVKSTDPNQCSTVVTYSNATASDNCAGVGTPACTPPSGSTFAKGTTTVNCSVTDASGNSANCSFTVTVIDTQPPTITCPASITAVTSSFAGSSTVVSYANPTLSDNCPGVTSSCNPPSGSTFPLGWTTVTCTATDASNNAASCTFPVCVFNICLQDDSNADNRILINTATGDYRFCCNGITFTGKGKITIQGSTYTLEHNPLDRRVRASASGSSNNGTASLQSPPGNLRCSFTDSNLSDNTTCTTCR